MNETSAFSVNPRVFYGENVQNSIPNIVTGNKPSSQPVPFKLRKLLGPSSIWEVFKKQADVLTFVNSRKCGLMSFVFQQNTGERLFLAAHPSWLWYHDSNKKLDSRSSYEIIQELTVCKLYFDIEFNKDVNPFHNGVEMLEIFIKIVCFYLYKLWGIQCSRRNILDMDSSTNKKFSRHLIFQLPNAVFRDNYNAGNFVKYICKNVQTFVDNMSGDNCPQTCELDNFIAENNIQIHQMKNLIVTNSNGKTGIFCDQGVYTKNRHFRLFKSSKIGKQTPLVLSEQNEYKPECSEEEIFLDSLITFITNDSDKLRVLEFQSDSVDFNRKLTKGENIQQRVNNVKASPFPQIDRFIECAAKPGHIWRSFYFQAPNLIVYDIIGNRFCGNVGRQHKSNNIKLIVDLSNACYYQKCYDPDCAGYKSVPVSLPYEVQFHIHDDLDCELSLLEQTECNSSKVDDYNSLFDDHDNELSDILDTIEDIPVESFSDNF
ncbi:hypothetical protein LSTR_LSTR009036 [Laodelphax striatellus]|uniref:DNA-directed primase/polymerase protein n=1 Tax=Laodelphax striatellus TaxID=195883 RepID=A0A482XC41_LAOST|nr:hypothetical protein LSTR_LSTR009036 [Laodelphax striatellus]